MVIVLSNVLWRRRGWIRQGSRDKAFPESVILPGGEMIRFKTNVWESRGVGSSVSEGTAAFGRTWWLLPDKCTNQA